MKCPKDAQGQHDTKYCKTTIGCTRKEKHKGKHHGHNIHNKCLWVKK